MGIFRHLYAQVLLAVVAGVLVGHLAPDLGIALKPLGEELRFVLITSEAHVADAGSRPAEAVAADVEGKSGLWLHVRRSESQKCARCWHKRPDVGTVSAHPELCGRCAVNLDGPGETRRYV